MREIIFRGKSIENNQWIYGDLCQEAGKVKISGRFGKCNDQCFHEVIPNTVGQFTGFEDRNGTKIFEGDIIRASSKKEDLYEIFWYKKEWRKRNFPKKHKCGNLACPYEFDSGCIINLKDFRNSVVVTNINDDSWEK